MLFQARRQAHRLYDEGAAADTSDFSMPRVQNGEFLLVSTEADCQLVGDDWQRVMW